MRDHMVRLRGEHRGHRRTSVELERTADADGIVHIVNHWRVRHQVPADDPFSPEDQRIELDRSATHGMPSAFTCSWTIEPNFLTEYIDCSGHTVFAPAMAGQGARVTFEGGFDLKPGVLGNRWAASRS